MDKCVHIVLSIKVFAEKVYDNGLDLLVQEDTVINNE